MVSLVWAIEALVALDGVHFHLRPRSAHIGRLRWVKEKFPSLPKDLDELWGAYGALGYAGIDGGKPGRLLSVWGVFWVSLKAKHRPDLKRIVDKVSGCCWGLSFREFC
jgi:hypothetical protein